jgi:hypothetical protein
MLAELLADGTSGASRKWKRSRIWADRRSWATRPPPRRSLGDRCARGRASDRAGRGWLAALRRDRFHHDHDQACAGDKVAVRSHGPARTCATRVPRKAQRDIESSPLAAGPPKARGSGHLGSGRERRARTTSMRKETAGRRMVLALALLMAATAASPGALAQTEQATKEAESRFKEGLGRHDAGDEEGARLSFLQAYSVLKRPNILFNLARAEQLTGHLVEALQHYKLFVADSTVTGADRDTAKRRIVELTPLVGHVTLDAPVGADLWIDGQMLPSKAPLTEPADVAPGTHSVQVRLGEQTKTVSVSCAAGQTVTAKIDIAQSGAPLVVVPIPAVGPATPHPPAGPEKTLPPDEKEKPNARVITTVVLSVGAVAFLAAGIGLEVVSANQLSNEQSDLTAFKNQGLNPSSACSVTPARQGCSTLNDAAQAHATDGNAAVGTLATAGVLGAAAVLTWSLWPKKKEHDDRAAKAERTRFVPLVSPRMTGLGVVGAF